MRTQLCAFGECPSHRAIAINASQARAGFRFPNQKTDKKRKNTAQPLLRWAEKRKPRFKNSWRINGESGTFQEMGLRKCKVSYCDPSGVEHSVEVTADSLYEAVAQGLRVFRGNDWINEVGRGQTTLSVTISHPEVQHKVRVQDFERWLESQGRTPVEMSLKARLRELLSEVTRIASRTTRNRI